MKYINGPKRSKRRDNKARTKQKRKNIDKEVEEFRKKLETVSPVKNRIKPNVTEDFIVKINELLKARALKKSLFSNLGR